MGATAPSRPLGWLLALSVIAAATPIGGCGEQGSTAAAGAARPGIPASRTKAAATQDPNTGTTETVSSRVSLAPAVTPAARVGAAWTPVATVAGGVAASEAARSGVTLLRFDQSLVKLALHAGSGEPSGSWKYGDRIEPSEIHRVIAAFNGGFKFGTGDVGYMSEGRTAVPLRAGRGSIVTYRDGTTEIGTWGAGVPVRGRPIASVLQNLSLLVDHGRVAGSAESCILPAGGQPSVA